MMFSFCAVTVKAVFASGSVVKKRLLLPSLQTYCFVVPSEA